MRVIILSFFVLMMFSASAQFAAFEVSLPSDTSDNLLRGTLVLPDHGKKFDIVVIQAGSGSTDRNGNSGKALTSNSYRLIAEALAKKNIATLLTDKRGVAGSSNAVRSESALRFDDYANDLVDWIRYMRKDPRIRKIFIAGHSEGSLIGMIAAQKINVDGYISIAGAGESVDKILVWQVSKQAPKAAPVLDSLLTRLRNNQKIDTVPVYLMAFLRPSVQPYIASWMAHDPCEEIKKVTVPILIVQGSTDLQVEPKEADILKGCNPKSTLKIIENMNHILKPAPADRKKNLAVYTEPELAISEGLITALVDFVNK